MCVLAVLFSIVCVSGAFGQTAAPASGVSRMEDATDALKTCLQTHFDAAGARGPNVQSGTALIEACRSEWDGARSVCVKQPGKTPEACNALTTMMLLGFAAAP